MNKENKTKETFKSLINKALQNKFSSIKLRAKTDDDKLECLINKNSFKIKHIKKKEITTVIFNQESNKFFINNKEANTNEELNNCLLIFKKIKEETSKKNITVDLM